MPQPLRDADIRTLEPPARGKRIIFDDHKDAPRGFGVRVTAGGTRAFVLRYRQAGTERMLTIGAWPTWSLTAARRQATELKRQVDAGADPIQERRDAQCALTFAGVAEQYLDRKVDALKTGPAVRRAFERDVLPVLGRMKLASVRRADIIDLLERKATGDPRRGTPPAPRAAVKLLITIKGMLAWAVDREMLDADPAAGLKPTRIDASMKRGGSRQRGRVLDDGEIRAFWAAVESCGMARTTALALKLVLVTGQRPGEVAGMRWSEVEGDVWTIPASRRGKTGDDHRVPLTGSALALLEEARAEVERLALRRRRDPGDAVFESWTGAPMTALALPRAVLRFGDQLGNRGDPTWGRWRPHDLRRTARTGLSASGVAEEVAERVVGHVRAGIVAVYDRHGYDQEKRAALEAWERRLLGIAEGRTGTVVPLVRTGARS